MKYVIRKKDTIYYIKEFYSKVDVNFGENWHASFSKLEDVQLILHSKVEAEDFLNKINAHFANKDIIFEIERLKSD